MVGGSWSAMTTAQEEPAQVEGRATTARKSRPKAGKRAVPTAGRENREGRLAAEIRRNEDQHPDELTVSKEQLLNKIENSTCQSLCDNQQRPRQCLAAHQLQFFEFNDKTAESQSRRRGRPPVIQLLPEERRRRR